MSLFKSFSRHGSDKQPPSPATTLNSQAVVTTTSTATSAAASAAALIPAEPEPVRADGSDKYYGMENFGNTCYCNSVVQALFYTKPFRDAVINYPRNNVSPPPPRPEPETATTTTSVSTENTPAASITDQQSTASTQPLAPLIPATSPNPNPPSPSTPKGLTKTKSNSMFSRGKLNRTNSSDPTDLPPTTSPVSPTMRPSSSFSSPNGVYGLSLNPNPVPVNPYAPSPYSLNGAIASTSIIAQNAQKDPNAPPPLPSIPLDYSRNEEYGMKESLFTCLKDLFERIVAEDGKSGVIAPTKLVEVLKRENGWRLWMILLTIVLFEGNTHQDAHEFLNYLLNDVVESVDRYEKSRSPDTMSKARWVHELFEGILTSETKCLTCENMTTRDEVFLDLSIDIEQNSSVSACLRQFSASEMLCERNKFHCDICGGLQEAEKRCPLYLFRVNIRMKVKKSPKILALHLKRFKYTEDMQRNLKLFHRVVYPPTLRLFNTTDDTEDPDRFYELYAVVVHIGGGPYHGHYVTIVKNDATGKWMLIDDEAVEAVDDGFVGRFYGDRPGMASAYVLFYQQVDQKPIEPVDTVAIPNGKVPETAVIANGVAKMDINEKRPVNGHSSQNSLDSLSRVPSSPVVVSRVPTHVTSLATVEEKAPQIRTHTTPPASPSVEPVTPMTTEGPMTTTPSVVPPSSNLERTPTKKELKDSAKREKEERKEREKREKEEAKKDSKKLKSGFGTIKRWGKDKDKS